MSLLRSGDILYFSIYILASVALGIAGVFAGIAIMKLL
jgi:fluoride ion exporter CrcB/FEX